MKQAPICRILFIEGGGGGKGRGGARSSKARRATSVGLSLDVSSLPGSWEASSSWRRHYPRLHLPKPESKAVYCSRPNASRQSRRSNGTALARSRQLQVLQVARLFSIDFVLPVGLFVAFPEISSFASNKTVSLGQRRVIKAEDSG